MLLTANILFAAALLGIGWLLLQHHRIHTILLMNQAEAQAALLAIKAQNAKIYTEVSAKLGELAAKIVSLEEQITNGALPSSVFQAMAGAAASTKAAAREESTNLGCISGSLKMPAS